MSIPFTYVYLIYDEFTGLYKIGKSDDPEKRLQQLKSQSTILAAPVEYSIVQAWLCPPCIETDFHQEFADRRVRGEWFKLSESNVRRIYDALSWYRRLYGNEPDCSVYRKRYYAWYIAGVREISALVQERDSLLRQRSYLVKQRDELLTFRYSDQTEAEATQEQDAECSR